MATPLGFCMVHVARKVCKLKKTLYGLKQSPRAWFESFRSAMLHYGYKQTQVNHNLFVKDRVLK